MADYTTAAAVKTYLHITTGTDDALIGELVTRASRLIDDQTGRWFQARTETRRYSTSGAHLSGAILLLDADLLAVTAIDNGSGDAIDPTQDVILRPLNMPPYFGVSIRATTGKVWTSAPDDLIAITGEWGYSATPPEVIEQAATRLAAWLYRQRDTGTDAPTLEVDERGVIAAPPRLPWDILQMLTPYTRIRVKAGAA